MNVLLRKLRIEPYVLAIMGLVVLVASKPARAVGLIALPPMLFHQLQLMVCAAPARRYRLRPNEPAPSFTVPV